MKCSAKEDVQGTATYAHYMSACIRLMNVRLFTDTKKILECVHDTD